MAHKKQLKIKVIGVCEWCHKKFDYVPDKRHPIHKFDSQKCRHAYRAQYVKEHGNSEKTRKKISASLIGKSLRERGFSKEAITNSIAALKKAGKNWNDSIRGKTYEEIYGKKKAQKIKKNFSENRRGDKNPFYEHHHTVATKEKIVNGREGKFYIFADGTFNNIRWQGSYELQLLVYCYENEIIIRRFDKKPIEYVYENRVKHYFPDFIIQEDNKEFIVECKGYSNEQNLIKIKAGISKYKKRFRIYRKKDVPLSLVPDKNINEWYSQIQMKYGDLLVIKHNPYV